MKRFLTYFHSTAFHLRMGALRFLAGFILGCAPGFQCTATMLVNDTWLDGSRAEPAAPVYSENGTDTDSDGDLESAWFQGGSGTLTPVGLGGPLRGTGFGTSSASWTTYFTPESAPVTLASAGDQIKITWVFTPTGVNTNNSSQGFPVALTDTPSTARLTSDNSPSSAAYTGYAVYMNMGQTLGHSHPFQLTTRNSGSAAFLSSSGAWTGVADGAVSGNHGYDSGTQYTFIMTVTRNAANGLDVVATMSGGTLNNSGIATASYTDPTPNGGSYSFDTFGIRPNSEAKTASTFDTSLFRVEFIAGSTPPTIDIDPQDRSAFTGQDATFSVLAGGTQPLSYQWYHNTNSPVDGGTNSTLTLTNVQPMDAGAYSAVVTNAYGSATSAVAQLTVSEPEGPSITTQPADQTVSPGGNATFSVGTAGSEPLSLQWYHNTNTPVPNGTDSILTLTNVQDEDAGSYTVVVTNIAGSITSSNAFLIFNTNPVAPSFTVEPASQIVLAGTTVTMSALAAGTAPISYQWNKGGLPIDGAVSPTLTLTNVQVSDNNNYTVTASNSVGTATSDAAQLTVTESVPIVNSAYNLAGFGRLTTGGGVIPDTDPAYKKVYTALDLANAIRSANKTAGAVKVIEIMNDLDLGWNEVGAAVQGLDSNPFRSHNVPKLHPRLLVTGVSLIDIKSKNGLTIFSANGSTIRHATFNLKGTGNIIIRNLKFDEMWEWDEASKGNYDENDWDFIDLGNAGTVSNIWIDHCTFTKAYDGIVDIKGGSYNITFSWNKYTGDDGATNTNSWVRQQINYLEQSPSSYPMYNFLRTHGFSVEDIVTIIQGHDKTHLIGANSLDSQNAQLSVTFHHQWYINPWDRLPRLRAGNVHNFNIYVDDILGLAAKRLRDARAAAMSSSDRSKLNNTYSFNPFLNGSISTESGSVLVEKSVYIDCLTPLRNNQTDPSNPTYTGKILALDTIYQMDSTTVRGNSTDPENPLGPFQATIIPFSWNLPGNQLPYTYSLDDPGVLQSIVTSPTAGAGAGVLTWARTNWLLTTYAPTAPVIVADPQSQTLESGQNVTFTALAAGSVPLRYQWYYNTNTPIANATNTFLTLTNLQSTNAGMYSVVATNSAGSASSQFATLTIDTGLTGFAAWQAANFTPEQLSNPAISGPDATPANDGVSNFVKYALGLSPFVTATQPLVAFRLQGGAGVLTYNRPVSVPDVVYEVQVSTNLTAWSTNGVSQQLVGTNGLGLQVWEGTYTGSSDATRFFRLQLIH